MAASKCLASIILHSPQHPSAEQKELKILADPDGWVSARNGSVQPGNEEILPSGMAATTCKHFMFNPTTPPQPCCSPTFLLERLFASLQRRRIVLCSFDLIFFARSTSVPFPHTVPEADKAADLRRQWVFLCPWLGIKWAGAAKTSPAIHFPSHSCQKAFPLSFELSERGREPKLTIVLS